MHDADELWNQCARSIRAQVSDVVWQTTFTGVAPLNIASNRLNLSVPSTIVKERIEGRFLALVRDALADVGAPELDLGFVVEKPAASEPEELPFATVQNNGETRDGSDNGGHPQVPQAHSDPAHGRPADLDSWAWQAGSGTRASKPFASAQPSTR